jgi:hypothetical protein
MMGQTGGLVMARFLGWQKWMELITSAAIIVSLIVLIVEVRTNTHALERQSRMDYLSGINQPYIDDVSMGRVLAKVKAVDGREENVSAFMAAYDLDEVEAAAWTRHLYNIWGGIEADYLYADSDQVESTILAVFPDTRLYWKINRDWHSPKFVALVDRLMREADAAK